MKRIFSLALVILIAFNSIIYAENFDEEVNGVLLGEFDTGEILYQKNINKKFNIASITKLMTYIITMEAIEDGLADYEDVVVIGENPPKEWGSTFYLEEGDMLPLKTLLDSIMIASANDSCVAIAEYIAGSEENFVKLMNKKARELNLNNTKYINSNGLPEANDNQNIMTIKEIYKLSRYVIKRYPEILDITDKRSIQIKWRKYKPNTNPLLIDMPWVDGLKTGYTDSAGYCLVSTINIPKGETNDKDMRFIGVLMGAESEPKRKIKSMELLNYGINNYKYKRIISDNKGITVNIKNAKNMEVKAISKEEINILVKNEDVIKTKILLKEGVDAPIKKNEYIGKLQIYKNDIKNKEVALYSSRDIKKANIFVRLFRIIFNKG